MLAAWDRRLVVASNVRPTTAYKPSGKPETLEALEWRLLEKGGKKMWIAQNGPFLKSYYNTSDMQNMVWGEPECVQNGIGM